MCRDGLDSLIYGLLVIRNVGGAIYKMSYIGNIRMWKAIRDSSISSKVRWHHQLILPEELSSALAAIDPVVCSIVEIEPVSLYAS